MVFILRIFTIEQVKNDHELLVIFGVNEERQDKDRRIYEIIFSFNGKSCDQLVGSPCVFVKPSNLNCTIFGVFVFGIA